MTYSMYQERVLLYRTLLSVLPPTNPSATRASQWVASDSENILYDFVHILSAPAVGTTNL